MDVLILFVLLYIYIFRRVTVLSQDPSIFYDVELLAIIRRGNYTEIYADGVV